MPVMTLAVQPHTLTSAIAWNVSFALLYTVLALATTFESTCVKSSGSSFLISIAAPFSSILKLPQPCRFTRPRVGSEASSHVESYMSTFGEV